MIVALLAAAAVFTLFLAVYLRERTRKRTETQMTDRLRAIARETPSDDLDPLLEERSYSQIPGLNRLLKRLSFTDRFARLALHAGVQKSVGEIILRMALYGVVAAAITFTFYASVVAAGLAFAAVGPGFGIMRLRRKRSGRRTTILRQLPDALDMIRSSLQAGHSFSHAMELVADEASEPIAGEFRQVLEELRLGHTMKAALNGVYDRTGIEDLRFFILSVVLNREIGGNLTEIIEAVARTIRERFKLAGQVRALTAQGRMSATVLTAMGPAIALALSMLAPDYMQPLYQTTAGHLLIGYGLTSLALGYYFMRKIVDIKVIRTD